MSALRVVSMIIRCEENVARRKGGVGGVTTLQFEYNYVYEVEHNIYILKATT